MRAISSSDVAQPPPRRDLALGAQQELHRREPDRPGAPPADAVDDRTAARPRAARAAAPARGSASSACYRRARWRANRKARSTSAGGSAVVANRYSTRASRQLCRQRSRSAADSRSNDAARSRGSTSSRRASSGLDGLEVGHARRRAASTSSGSRIWNSTTSLPRDRTWRSRSARSAGASSRSVNSTIRLRRSAISPT